MLTTLLVLSSTLAGAQSVPNGDFETFLDEWTVTNAVSHQNTSNAPSPTGYAFIPNLGSAVESIESSPFVITRTELVWRARGRPFEWKLYDADDHAVAGAEVSPGDDTPWFTAAADTSELCGQEVTLWIGVETDGDYVRIDSVKFANRKGVFVCEEFLDVDGDGTCPRGRILDSDGDCADDGEVTLDVVDCDEQDPARSADAEEKVASGVDEDCDGLELCYEDTDGDGYGSARTVASEAWDCEGPGLATNADESCEGHDDAVDLDGNGVPDGCDGDEEVPPDPPSVDTADPGQERALVGTFRGGAGCSTGGMASGAWLSWLAVAWLGRRRRR